MYFFTLLFIGSSFDVRRPTPIQMLMEVYLYNISLDYLKFKNYKLHCSNAENINICLEKQKLKATTKITKPMQMYGGIASR